MMLLLLKLTLRAKGIENYIYYILKQQSIGNFILYENEVGFLERYSRYRWSENPSYVHHDGSLLRTIESNYVSRNQWFQIRS